jgi:hypothetical protein
MALNRGDLAMLVRLREEGKFPASGAVAEIGAQQLSHGFFDSDNLRRVAELFGADPARVAQLGVPVDAPDLSADAPPARKFWEWLGFRYAAIDIDGTPGTIALDLNWDRVPRRLVGRHQVVTNFGTTEHIANQLNVFKIIHDLAASGSVMVHVLPMQGDYCHGLFNYNLKFFWMLARSNEYEWLLVDCAGVGEPQELPPDIVDWVSRYQTNFEKRLERLRVARGGLRVVLRKTRDMAFVAPIDVATGTPAPNAVLARRYWTVFGGPPPKRRWWRRS